MHAVVFISMADIPISRASKNLWLVPLVLHHRGYSGISGIVIHAEKVSSKSPF